MPSTLLIQRWNVEVVAERRKLLALPIALSRLERGFDFLLAVVRDGHSAVATAAMEALRLYRHEPARRERIEQAIDARGERALALAFNKAFNEDDV